MSESIEISPGAFITEVTRDEPTPDDDLAGRLRQVFSDEDAAHAVEVVRVAGWGPKPGLKAVPERGSVSSAPAVGGTTYIHAPQSPWRVGSVRYAAARRVVERALCDAETLAGGVDAALDALRPHVAALLNETRGDGMRDGREAAAVTVERLKAIEMARRYTERGEQEESQLIIGTLGQVVRTIRGEK